MERIKKDHAGKFLASSGPGVKGSEKLSISTCTVISYMPSGLAVKNPLPMQETWVRFLDGQDPLEKGMAIHSSILVRIIPWTEQPSRLQSVGSQQSDTTEHTRTHNTLEEYDTKLKAENYAFD